MTEDPLTIEQVLAAAEQRGLQLPERTFRYYAAIGLLPTTERPAGKGDGRWHYYPPSTVDKLLTIRGLQVDGYSLKQIREALTLRTEAGDTVPEAPAESGASGVAARLLKAMADVSLADALRRIRTAGDESAMRQAVLDYYRRVLRGVVGSVDLEQILNHLTPLEVQALLRPFRGTPSGRARAPWPPWLEALRNPGQDAAHWSQHVRRVQNEIEAHAAQKDPALHAVWLRLKNALADSVGLWDRRDRGETIGAGEIEPVAARLRSCLSFLKAGRSLGLWDQP